MTTILAEEKIMRTSLPVSENNSFSEWLSSRTAEEENLFLTAIDYEYQFFEDMTFQENSLCWNIASFKDAEFDHLYLGISNYQYRFYITADNNSFMGMHDCIDKTITITQSHIHDTHVLLHEMLHAYEAMLNDQNPILRENLLIALYRKLTPKIPDLPNRIQQHSELYGQQCVTSFGGSHGLLFFLKSLDLDIRLGYSLGTVCGYGRDTGEMFY